MTPPLNRDDYERAIDQFGNAQQAHELLKLIHAAAGMYFAFMETHGIQVGSLSIYRNVPPGDGTVIHKRYQGGRLVSEH
jgi:hypothetical protein